MSTQTIWREGGRIRRTDGTGYGDRVSDDQIRDHIVAHQLQTDIDNINGPLFVPFARAVLAIRSFERISAGAPA